MPKNGAHTPTESDQRPAAADLHGPGKYTVTGLVLAALALFGYTTTRAYTVPMSHDEAMGYFYIFRTDLSQILAFVFESSNNHILNSILTWISLQVFGNYPFALRVPNLCAHLLYLTASIQIARQFRHKELAFICFGLLNLNPFLLDFFSLSRGYGLANAFALLALWMFSRFITSTERRESYASLTLWAAYFAVLSNFAFLTPYLALTGVLFAVRSWHEIRTNGSFQRPVGTLTGVCRANGVVFRHVFMLFATIVIPITRLVLRKELYYGGVKGFVVDTVQSLVSASLYDYAASPKLVWFLSILFIVLFVALGAWLAYATFTLGKDRESPLIGLGMLAVTLTCVALLYAEHFFAGARFSIQRSALYFIPLYMLTLSWAMASMGAWGKTGWKRVSYWCIAGGTALALIPWLLSMNLTHEYYTKYDATTPEMLKRVNEDRQQQGIVGRRITIGLINLSLEPVINYYLVQQPLAWLFPVRRDGLGKHAYDYYYMRESEITNAEFQRRNTEVICRYPLSGCVLFRQK